MIPTVHVLRPFLATQKGQVSVDPCDTLILLSEVHWYWWFVRVCDRGIEGFVPAELLELPDERLARINRDLNIHLPPDPIAKTGPTREGFKKSIRFNDNCLATYAVEDKSYDDDLYEEPAELSSPSSDDTDSDSTDSLSSPIDQENPLGQTGNKIPISRLHIQSDDIDLKHELTAQAL